jgi:MFS family permease
VLIFANVSATAIGIGPELAPYFVAIGNAGSLFGRWASGIVSDKIGQLVPLRLHCLKADCSLTGPMNVMIPTTFVAAIFTYGWPFANSTASLIVITLIYGFCSGTYVSLMTNPIMNLGGEGDIGRRIGMFMSILAIGALCGPPISGTIQASTGSFHLVGVFAGEFHVQSCMDDLDIHIITPRYCCDRGRWVYDCHKTLGQPKILCETLVQTSDIGHSLPLLCFSLISPFTSKA